MQEERLPVPDSPHKMLIYSSGNCSLLICPSRKTLICHYSTMFYNSSLFFGRALLLYLIILIYYLFSISIQEVAGKDQAFFECLFLLFNYFYSQKDLEWHCSHHQFLSIYETCIQGVFLLKQTKVALRENSCQMFKISNTFLLCSDSIIQQ